MPLVSRVIRNCTNDRSFSELNFWLLPITIAGEQGKCTFDVLLDTGAQRTVFTQDIQEIVGIQGGRARQIVTPSGFSNCIEVTINQLEIASIPFNQLNVLICKKLPGRYRDYKINGFLGTDVLSSLVLELNYLTGEITLEKTIVNPN
ncbi:MAG: clan AA aspartic protease [Cyanobacteria bacterium SBLK]|nr:clan AA aspartic protease [Cyanobacteria bacterium SBLK]